MDWVLKKNWDYFFFKLCIQVTWKLLRLLSVLEAHEATKLILVSIAWSSKVLLLCPGWNASPFYSCVLGCQAFEQEQGKGWPCFDTNIAAFQMQITLLSW